MDYIDLFRTSLNESEEKLLKLMENQMKYYLMGKEFTLLSNPKTLQQIVVDYIEGVSDLCNKKQMENNIIEVFQFKHHLEVVEILGNIEVIDNYIESVEGVTFSSDKTYNLMNVLYKSLQTGENYSLESNTSFQTKLFKDTDSFIKWIYDKFDLKEGSYKVNSNLISKKYAQNLNTLDDIESINCINFEYFENLSLQLSIYLGYNILGQGKVTQIQNKDNYMLENLIHYTAEKMVENMSLGKNTNYLGIPADKLEEFKNKEAELIIRLFSDSRIYEEVGVEEVRKAIKERQTTPFLELVEEIKKEIWGK